MEKEKFVINIGREYGSGGLKIAQMLSKKLGINYYDKSLIEIAAKKSGISKEVFEQTDEKSIFSLFADVSAGVANIFGAGYYNDSCLLNDSLFKIQSDIIKQLARKESCIFVGRCADYVLRDNPRSVNVFVCGNIDDRIERILKDSKDKEKTKEKVQKEIEHTDKQREKYYEFYTSKQWGAAATYQMCINSSVMGLEKTAEIICCFAKEKLNLQ